MKITISFFLNFFVLQWFGFRLARRIDTEGNVLSWFLLRWLWPLTGWWSDYRWIARKR